MSRRLLGDTPISDAQGTNNGARHAKAWRDTAPKPPNPTIRGTAAIREMLEQVPDEHNLSGRVEPVQLRGI
jgi:hypothetical protein